MSFSFEKGKKIAKIVGGEFDGLILRINDNPDDSFDFEGYNPLDYLGKEFFKKRLIKLRDVPKLEKALKLGQVPHDDNLKRAYDEALKMIKDKDKELILYDGYIQQIPSKEKNQVDRLYVSGPQGSGKSTYISNFIKEYNKAYPKNPVFIFSRKDEDKAFDKLKPRPIRIMIDEEMLEEPINLDELKNSLVIFDDIDTIMDKDLNKEIHRLRDDVLECGRSYGISICSSSHQTTNWSKTRNTLLESNSKTIFPKSGAQYSYTRLLKEYNGLNPTQIKKILNLPSRWVTILCNYPTTVLYDKGAYIL